MTRRLAAIMFTDIAGYTALGQKDEPSALRLLQEQENVVRPLVERHHGRRVKSMGDGLLIEFPDALDAVECGVELQRRVHERNSRKNALPLPLRVGIHLGDVQRRGTDILGDAVNIASRIEPLAEPEGVCISLPVYDQVHNKVDCELEKLGPRTLKGVRDPVEVYRVVFPWSGKAPTAAPPLPRIAVLPLASISPDPQDEYFADGLTEELISTLSGIRGLRVIAHTSVNRFKGSDEPASRIGSELGVSSLLEGSVRKAGDRLRISLQLIDVGSQEHTWSANYDRTLDDVFAIQADVAEQTAAALRVELRKDEGERLKTKPTPNPESYLAYLKARALGPEGYTERGLNRSKELLEKAIALDGSNARAYAGLANTLGCLSYYLAGPGRDIGRERALVRKALELDSDFAEAHSELGTLLRFEPDFAGATKEYELALSLDPSCAVAHHDYGLLLMDLGRTDEALQEFAIASEADPLSPNSPWMRLWLLTSLGRMNEAETVYARVTEVDGKGMFWHQARQVLAHARSDTSAVRRELEWFARSSESPVYRLAATAELLLEQGRRDEMPAVMEQIRTGPYDPRIRANMLAELHAKRNELDECFEWIEELTRLHGLEFLRWRLDPDYANVRSDPRYQALLHRLCPT